VTTALFQLGLTPSRLAAVVVCLAARCLTHLRPGASQGLDLPLDGLIKCGDQSEPECTAALPNDIRRINCTGRLDLQSHLPRDDALGIHVKPRAAPVQVANNSVHDFLPRTVSDPAAKNAPLSLRGTTVGFGFGWYGPHGASLPKKAFKTIVH